MTYILGQIGIAIVISGLLHIIGLGISQDAPISLALIPTSVFFLTWQMALYHFDARIIKNKGIRETYRIKLRAVASDGYTMYLISLISIIGYLMTSGIVSSFCYLVPFSAMPYYVINSISLRRNFTDLEDMIDKENNKIIIR